MRRVAVHMVDGPSIEGLLKSYRTRRYGQHYLIDHAVLVTAPDQSRELEGNRVRVPRERVLWVQEL